MGRRATNGAGPWERQIALFDPPPPSPAPLLEVPPGLAPLARRVLETVIRAGALGMTCDEIERVTGLPHQSASARVHELERARLIVNSGRTRATRAGRRARVWVVKGTKLTRTR